MVLVFISVLFGVLYLPLSGCLCVLHSLFVSLSLGLHLAPCPSAAVGHTHSPTPHINPSSSSYALLSNQLPPAPVNVFFRLGGPQVKLSPSMC